MKEEVEFDSIEKVADEIELKLASDPNKKKIVLLYAFNATGKTRLSTLVRDKLEVDDSDEIRVLGYNAYFEDLFSWDNEEYILKFNPQNRIIQLIIDQGLENEITDNFQKFTRSKIFPQYHLDSGSISFSFSPGDDRSEENIKISRGEESLFVWCVFYTVLQEAIEVVKDKEENRSTDQFNHLQYIIIDDPVSSIDDTKIITMAVELIKLLDSANDGLKFFITTHHALFFNILHNGLKKGRKSYLLSKYGTTLMLKEAVSDTPFAYHIVIKNEIQDAIDKDSVQRYHFNLFRGLLEKTASFYGQGHWGDCLEEKDREEITRIMHLYSHGKLSELESSEFPEEHKDLFKEAFNSFAQRFK